jgi:aminomethyltransferase
MSDHAGPLQRTPLHAVHQALGAKLVPFAGYEMPLQYTGILDEHRAVRGAMGLFDVSHMGEVELRGPRAREAAQRLCTADIGKLKDSRAVYTVMCNEAGGIVDDCIFYQHAADRVMVVINAANIDKDLAWIRQHASPLCEVVDLSAETALIAVQGPRAVEVLSRLATPTAGPLAEVPSFAFVSATLAGQTVLMARTGYTGEDGFEIFVPNAGAAAVWNAVLEAGRPEGAQPAGLGARDTLRLEAALRLYGQDMDDRTNPFEAGLGWVVKLDAGDFVGKAALVKSRTEGQRRQLVGLSMTGRGIARHGYPVHADEAAPQPLGEVTSGTTSPTLGMAVALAYLPPDHAAVGTAVSVDCRGKRVAARVVKTPFYRRKA